MASILDCYKKDGTSIFNNLELANTRKATSNFETFDEYKFRNATTFKNTLYKNIKAWHKEENIPNYKVDGVSLTAISKGYLPVDFTFTARENATTLTNSDLNTDEGFNISGTGAIRIATGVNPRGDGEDFTFTLKRTDDYIFDGASNSGKGTYHTYKDIADPGLYPGAVIKKTFESLGYIPKAVTLILGAGGGAGAYANYGGQYGGGAGGGAAITAVLDFSSVSNIYFKVSVGNYGWISEQATRYTAHDGGTSKIASYLSETIQHSVNIFGGGGGKFGSEPGMATPGKGGYVGTFDKTWTDIKVIQTRNGKAGGYPKSDGEGYKTELNFGSIYNSTTTNSIIPTGGAVDVEGREEDKTYFAGGGASPAYSGGDTSFGWGVAGKYGSGAGSGVNGGSPESTTGGRGWFILVY